MAEQTGPVRIGTLQPLGALAVGTVVRLPDGAAGYIAPAAEWTRSGRVPVENLDLRRELPAEETVHVLFTPLQLGMLCACAPYVQRACLLAQAIIDAVLRMELTDNGIRLSEEEIAQRVAEAVREARAAMNTGA